MIKLSKNNESMKISIFLKNGRSLLERDITNQPFGESEKIVGCWSECGNVIEIYPMDQVEKVELVFDGEE